MRKILILIFMLLSLGSFMVSKQIVFANPPDPTGYVVKSYVFNSYELEDSIDDGDLSFLIENYSSIHMLHYADSDLTFIKDVDFFLDDGSNLPEIDFKLAYELEESYYTYLLYLSVDDIELLATSEASIMLAISDEMGFSTLSETLMIYYYFPSEPSDTFTITFDSSGGSAVDPIIIEDGELATAPTAPTRSGFTFGGWYQNIALTLEMNWDDPIISNYTLYAKWTASSSGGGEIIPEASYDSGPFIVIAVISLAAIYFIFKKKR